MQLSTVVYCCIVFVLGRGVVHTNLFFWGEGGAGWGRLHPQRARRSNPLCCDIGTPWSPTSLENHGAKWGVLGFFLGRRTGSLMGVGFSMFLMVVFRVFPRFFLISSWGFVLTWQFSCFPQQYVDVFYYDSL